ncbi:hypothetical protein FOZ60_002224 [Perkinsus olseni]|uniref:Uncharacterized protein n=1 Tax=Perkinsus olseni TaxID=32597 RepID=A0A7J6NZ93_PEROL|nr:hypothetical protein FOZ60_002224 [Perkinsus olseni]
MVVTRSNKIGDSESIASNASNASRIPRPKTKAKAKSKSSTSYLYDESDDVPSVDSRHPPPIVTATPPTPFSHSTGMKIPAQSSGSTDQDDERLPHDQHVEDPDDLSLKDHPTSVQEHSLRAGGTDPLREDLPSGQEHPLQGDESDPLREDLNLVLDQHRQQGDSDPLRKDPPSVLDPSLRAGDSDPLRRDQLTNPSVDDLHVEGADSPRRSPRASLSGPSLRPDGVHPLRKDHVSTVPSSHLHEEDDSLRKSLSFPGIVRLLYENIVLNPISRSMTRFIYIQINANWNRNLPEDNLMTITITSI